MYIRLKTERYFNGKKILGSQMIDNMVQDKINQYIYGEGLLERINEKLGNTQKFIAQLIELLTVKGLINDKELIELIETDEDKILEVVKED